jgi:DNA polymerase-3 subunit epsilon
MHHDVEAEPPNILAYMALIDRILEDRTIDPSEENSLVDAVLNWKLSASQIDAAHAHYLSNLAVAALADGIVTDSERRDLHVVARLLGQDDISLDSALETAAAKIATVHRAQKQTLKETVLAGQSVCFTGQLRSTINGEAITRNVAEALATEMGMIVASTVTKKLDMLVVADPNTQSGKAKKAREYGIRVLSDLVFWRMIGISVD